eukprot:scaffold8701_cov120-Isochrysis_galbana.AAC.7
MSRECAVPTRAAADIAREQVVRRDRGRPGRGGRRAHQSQPGRVGGETEAAGPVAVAAELEQEPQLGAVTRIGTRWTGGCDRARQLQHEGVAILLAIRNAESLQGGLYRGQNVGVVPSSIGPSLPRRRATRAELLGSPLQQRRGIRTGAHDKITVLAGRRLARRGLRRRPQRRHLLAGRQAGRCASRRGRAKLAQDLRGSRSHLGVRVEHLEDELLERDALSSLVAVAGGSLLALVGPGIARRSRWHRRVIPCRDSSLDQASPIRIVSRVEPSVRLQGAGSTRDKGSVPRATIHIGAVEGRLALQHGCQQNAEAPYVRGRELPK